MQHEVLQLDITGQPQAWISVEDAAGHVATGSVVLTAGDEPLAVLRGGQNSRSGMQSMLEIPAIIAVRGAARINLFDQVPCFSKAKLVKRDRGTCAYCLMQSAERDMTVDHVIPESRGGALDWMNTVAACRSCNMRKANRTPEEAGMPLCFLPYVPSRYEDFLLKGRRIRADVHEWLAAKLPRGSRLA